MALTYIIPIVKPTALGPVANTDTKLLIYRLFQKGRVLAQDDLSKGEQASWRKRLQWAYNRPEYEEALTALEQLHGELEERNQSAAGSLEEGLEETLTLHRLGVHAVLGRSFKTTNCLESVSALVEERCAKGRPLEELEPTPTLVGNGARRHRTALEEGGGLPVLRKKSIRG